MISQVTERIKDGLNKLRVTPRNALPLGQDSLIDGLIQEVEWLGHLNTAFLESESQLHRIMDSVGESMTLLDTALHIIWVNKAGEEMFGQDIIGKKCYEVYLRADKPCEPSRCPARQTFSDGKPHAHEIEVFDLQGKKALIHCSYNVALRDESGKPTAAISVARDLTERLQLEKILLKSKKEWEATFDAIGELVSIHDRNLCISRCNKAVKEWFALPWNELIGRQCHDIFDCLLDADGQCVLEKTLRDGQSRCEEMLLSPQKQTLLVSVYPIQGDGEVLEGVIRIAKDISEMKNLEAQVRQAQKMEAIGALAGGIVHDFNNVLSAINGFAQLTTQLLPAENEKCHQNLKKILEACGHARALTRQILSFSRRSDQEPTQLVLLQTLIKESLSLMRLAITKNIEIREVLSFDTARVSADPTQIHQVLMNLCTNAAYAMRNTGGVLELGLERIRIDDQLSSRPADLQPGPYCLLTVKDTGEGMDEQTMKRIFEPFFTTKPDGVGTGMGLSVVHGIVKKHRGAITVQSEKDKGTCFRIFLPEHRALPVAVDTGRPAEYMRQRLSLPTREGTDPCHGGESCRKKRKEAVLFLRKEEMLQGCEVEMMENPSHRPAANEIASQPGGAIMLNRASREEEKMNMAAVKGKAKALGINQGKMNKEKLIREIQIREGYSACFRGRRTCPEDQCCWREDCLKN